MGDETEPWITSLFIHLKSERWLSITAEIRRPELKSNKIDTERERCLRIKALCQTQSKIKNRFQNFTMKNS